MACFNGSGIRKRRHHIIKVVADILCVAVVVSGVLVIQHQIGTFQRGFFCDDESIKHPVKSDTISVPLVLAIGLTVPFVVMLGVEYVFRSGSPILIVTPKTYGLKVYWLAAAYNALAVFIFGSVVTQFLTELAKHSVGRLRPHFLTLCDPNLDELNCSKGYITEFKCRSTDDKMLKEARLSFPSGHSSFAVYCAVYLILYLEGRLACRTIVLAKPVTQLIIFALAFFTCLSRISDYKHHWSDVLAGAVLGAAVSTSMANVPLAGRYETWYNQRKSDCCANFVGTTRHMEVATAEFLWPRSVDDYCLRYTMMLLDEDAEASAAQQRKIYPVSKEECTNHVAKRLALLANCSKRNIQLGGRPCKATMDKLQKYYDWVIRKSDMNEKMKAAITATINHCSVGALVKRQRINCRNTMTG
ncbi:phospholipid phosphatase 1 [Elysia marginata]|uniref:Phospholipid phosphatase 1 n=1 Tax=Elysia marginata TaxID=1093978 RepID=A0AAV4HR43_9GAST|nr:phospholipid phosphatase 1 [Elysia marginata]